MLNNLRNAFYGKIEIDNVFFINKFKPSFVVKIMNYVKYIFKGSYYLIHAPTRLKIYKFFINNTKLFNVEETTFDTVYFELRTRCNSQCSFCMASILTDNRNDIEMDMNLYKKIIDELKEKDFSGTIGFYVNNEPLLVKNLEEFICYARYQLSNAKLRILTNGIKLNENNGRMLLNSGIDEIEVNVYQKSIDQKIPKGIIKFEKNVLLPLINRKKITSDLKFEYKNRLVHYHKVLRDIGEILTSRGGSAPNWDDKNTTYDGHCAYPFWQINITADGRVGQCCADFYFDQSKLNCNNENIYNIWQSEFFIELRRNLINGDRSKNNLCKKCDYAGENPRRTNSILGKLFIGLIT